MMFGCVYLRLLNMIRRKLSVTKVQNQWVPQSQTKIWWKIQNNWPPGSPAVGEALTVKQYLAKFHLNPHLYCLVGLPKWVELIFSGRRNM